MTKREQRLINKYAKMYADNESDTVRKEIVLKLITERVNMEIIAQTTGLPIDELLRMEEERKIV